MDVTLPNVVTFDLEGTLVDLESIHFNAFAHAVQTFGVTLTSEQIISLDLNIVGGGDEFVARTIASRYSLDASKLKQQKESMFAQLLQESDIQLRCGASEFLSRLLSSKNLIAVGSVTPRQLGDYIVKTSGLDEYVLPEHVVFKEDVARPKPAPDVFLETARKLGVEPSDQLVFEDSVPGVRAAVAAGSPVIAVSVHHDQKHLTALKEAGAQQVFTDWSQVVTFFG